MPVAVCQLCNGPIGMGEPVRAYDDGVAHYFKHTCAWHKEQEALFIKAVGIDMTTAVGS